MPVSEPTGLKACAMFSRRVLFFFSPNDKMNGLAVVSRKARPKVRIYNAKQKNMKLCCCAAGMDKSAPAA